MKKLLLVSIALLFALPAYAQVVTTSGGKPVTTGAGLPVQVGPTSRVSLVATGTIPIPNNFLSTASMAGMTRKAHYNRSTSTRFQLVYGNWYIGTASNYLNMEVPTGNSISLKAWIEYPSGTYTQVLFSGSASAVIIPSGTTQLSDFLTISIPNGARFWTWTYETGSGGNNIPYNNTSQVGNTLWYATNGGDENADFATSGVPTSPSAGMSDSNSGRNAYAPFAILGDTTQPTGVCVGDSRTAGSLDIADISTDLGNCARAVGPTTAYINLGISSDRMGAYFASHALRDALITTVNPSFIIDELGTNEFNQQAASVTQWEGASKNLMAHMINTFPTIPVFRTTMAPWDSSTDNFATPVPANWGVNCGNQTGLSFNANQTTENQHIRSNSFDSVPFIDLALPVLTAQDSGCWKANGIANYFTNGGGHESQNGNKAIVASGVINPLTLAATAPISYSYPSMTLTVSGTTPTYVAGEFGNAAVLNGATSLTNIGWVPGVPQITAECWMQMSSNQGGSNTVFTAGDDIFINASGDAGIHTSDGTFHTSSTVVSTGSYHHLAFTVTAGLASNSTETLYVDGTQALQFTRSISSTQWSNYIGFVVGGSSGKFFTGDVDECAVFNYVKYTTNFTPPVSAYTGSETGLVGLYHFDNSLAGVRGPAGD